MKNLISIFAVTFLISGCAGFNGGPTTNFDRFTGTTINTTGQNTLPSSVLDPGVVMLDMRQEVKPGLNATYYLVLGAFSLNGPVLFPAPGESLFLIVDNDRIAFSTSLQPQGQSWFYPATAQQLNKIGSAQNVEVRIVQISGASFEKKLSSLNRRNFKDFVDKFITSAPTTNSPSVIN